MAEVAYGQSGYAGTSMSERAQRAYADGEMPKSKWTKKAMVSALRETCEVAGRIPLPETEKMRKDEMFRELFGYAGWHHTLRFANETEFYAVREEAALSDRYSREMTPDESEAHAQRKHGAEVSREEPDKAAEERRRMDDERWDAEKARLEDAETAAGDRLRAAMSADEYAKLMQVYGARTRPNTEAAKTYFAQAKMHPGRFAIETSRKGRKIVRSRKRPDKSALLEDAMYRKYCD